MTFDLFSSGNPNNYEFEDFDLPDATIRYYPTFFSHDASQKFFDDLCKNVPWKQEKIHMHGKLFDIPRLTAWYGDTGRVYTYSGIRVEPNPWIDTLIEINNKIFDVEKKRFNSVLLNRYRDGSDGVAWHADDERELGQNPVIASISFGQPRTFQMKHNASGRKLHIVLENGSLLLMGGTTQTFWQHQVPKSKRKMCERINLTFRNVA